MRFWQKFAACLFVKPFFRLFFNFKVFGLEFLKNLSGPMLIIGNHKFFIDSFAAGAAIPVSSKIFPISFMGKTRDFSGIGIRFLQKIGVVKAVYLLFGVFAAIRGRGLDMALERPKEIIKKNGVVFIHPEGRVNTTEDIGQFKRGAPALALSTGVKILPVVFKIQRKRLRRPLYIVKFGPSFFLPRDIAIEQGADYMRNIIVSLYKSL